MKFKKTSYPKKIITCKIKYKVMRDKNNNNIYKCKSS